MLANSINCEEFNGIFSINANNGVLSGRLLSLEGVIKTLIFLSGAFVGQKNECIDDSFQR